MANEKRFEAYRTDVATVLASVVFRLSVNAAMDDGLEISDPNCGQSTFATIATRGSATKLAPTAAGR